MSTTALFNLHIIVESSTKCTITNSTTQNEVLFYKISNLEAAKVESIVNTFDTCAQFFTVCDIWAENNNTLLFYPKKTRN